MDVLLLNIFDCNLTLLVKSNYANKEIISAQLYRTAVHLKKKKQKQYGKYVYL